MLDWSLMFFVLAIVAAIFGFGAVATSFAFAAKILFFIFIALLIVSFTMRALRGSSVV